MSAMRWQPDWARRPNYPKVRSDGRLRMYTKALTPRELFDGTVCYEIPPFQRPYVWNEEDQWQPLWADVERVASALDAARGDAGVVAPHFLGAVVLKQLPSAAGDPTRHSVIDGQQRLTTLQILLAAVHRVTQEHGDEDDAETLMELVTNTAKRFRSTQNRFKLWPSRVDRQGFECAMENGIDPSERVPESRILDAHKFFSNCVREWAQLDDVDSGNVEARLRILTEVLQQKMVIVTINLDNTDEDQLIFETLNDRGTPLLAADLIKNMVFQRGEALGANVELWSEKYWADFDEEWWRREVQQGRLFRSRIDLFLQYWLTMREQSVIPAEKVFANFRDHASPHLTSTEDATQFLVELRRDADTFRGFAELDPGSAPGRFYGRVVEELELGATIPLLLWLISDNHDVGIIEIDRSLSAVESWCVRRTLLQATMNDVNRFVISLLQHLDESPTGKVGQATVEFLLDQTADSRQWPTDQQLLEGVPPSRLYGNVRRNRLCMVLSAVEQKRRSERSEDVTLPLGLQIEHIMPQKWRTHWADGIANDVEKSGVRDRLVQSIGNLTLVTGYLNISLSNRPWHDSVVDTSGTGGSAVQKGKRSLIDEYSLLVLNKEIVQSHPDVWTEADIVARGQSIAKDIALIWPRG